MNDSTKERFYFIQNKFIWNYFYTIGDYNKYLNTIRRLIGRCNRYFERWLYLIPQDFGMIREVFSGRSLIEKAETEKGASLTTNSFSLLSSVTLLSKNGGYLLSHFYAVPSTWLGLTSLFGMGRGGSPTL